MQFVFIVNATVEYNIVIIIAAGKQVTNSITSYIDGSAVYGSSDTELAALRTTGGNSYLSNFLKTYF